MQWDFPSPFSIQTTVETADIDGLQHTNNAVYVKWCERVAWTHSESLKLDLPCYQRLDRAMVITRSEFDYLQASRLGDEIAIATWITDWDQRFTMQRRFQVIRRSDQVTLLRARMLFACVELSSGKPRRLPPEFLQGYGAAVLKP
jgi:acyl-CoA thioester hydrolase